MSKDPEGCCAKNKLQGEKGVQRPSGRPLSHQEEMEVIGVEVTGARQLVAVLHRENTPWREISTLETDHVMREDHRTLGLYTQKGEAALY